MGSYTVEQVEFLRQRADITYEEALEVLERCGGDLTRCLVDLERRGKIRKTGARTAPKTAKTRTSAHAGSYQEGSSLSSLLKKILRMRLVVTKESRTYVDLPVMYLALAVICAPHLMLFTVIAMFVMGLKIRVENGAGAKVGNEQFYDTVDKVADNIKTTVTNFARAAQENTQKAHRQDVENHTPYHAQPQNETIVYAQPAAQEEAAEETAQEAESEADHEAEPEIDIPDVTPYEAFTGMEVPEADGMEKDGNDENGENEIIIG